MPTVKDPTTILYGTRKITIALKEYVCDNFEVTYPSKILERSDENDEDSGAVIIPKTPTGTATMQLDADSTVPAIGAPFTTTGAGAGTYLLTEVGVPESKDAIRLTRIAFRKQIGA
jgi:hypothetical protein